uniref:Uncharacterized protein n=1 Tax=Timema monikensis TaxID=170555 RepID=A0A7R9DXM9_9NEOP|nr:unnamed protein product [Timema monikensis]
MLKLAPLLRPASPLEYGHKIRLFLLCVMSILLYSAPVFSYLPRYRYNHFRTVYHRFLRLILGAPPRVPNRVLLTMSGLPSLDSRIRGLAVRFFTRAQASSNMIVRGIGDYDAPGHPYRRIRDGVVNPFVDVGSKRLKPKVSYLRSKRLRPKVSYLRSKRLKPKVSYLRIKRLKPKVSYLRIKRLKTKVSIASLDTSGVEDEQKIDDGVLVYLKGGAVDKIFFSVTFGLCGVGLTGFFHFVSTAAFPKKESTIPSSGVSKNSQAIVSRSRTVCYLRPTVKPSTRHVPSPVTHRLATCVPYATVMASVRVVSSQRATAIIAK